MPSIRRSPSQFSEPELFTIGMTLLSIIHLFIGQPCKFSKLERYICKMYCKISFYCVAINIVNEEFKRSKCEGISTIVYGIQQGHQRSRIILSITQGDHVLKDHINNQL